MEQHQQYSGVVEKIRGILDTSFNPTGTPPGTATTQIGTSSDSRAQGVAIDSDGKIVLAGYTDDGPNYVFAVARYT